MARRERDRRYASTARGKLVRKANHFKERFPGLEPEWLRERITECIGIPCKYCHVELNLENCSADHKVSVKHGGGNEQNNFQLICKKCNRGKGDFDDRFFVLLLDLAERYKERENLLKRLAMATMVFGRRF